MFPIIICYAQASQVPWQDEKDGQQTSLCEMNLL